MLTSCPFCFSTKVFASNTKENVLGQYNNPTLTITYLPASVFIPWVDATTQEFLHTPQNNLSRPSFTHPHFAAATASILEGLLAYVARRYVDSRLRNEAVDDGLYSDVEGGVTESGVAAILEPGFEVRDLRVPRERIAAR